MQLNDELLGQASWSLQRKWLGFLAAMIAIVLSVIGFSLVLASLYRALNIRPNEYSFLGLFSLLLVLGGGHIGVWLVLRFGYRRGFFNLINPYRRPIKQQLIKGGLFALVLLLLGELFSRLVFPELRGELVWQRPEWFYWFLPYALAILIQTSAEELVFRGYMQQYLASLIPHKFVYYAVPALLWSGLHIGNLPGYPLTDIAAVISTFLLGLILADWADQSKSLAGPIAIHFVNNFYLIVFFGGSLQPAEMQIWRTNFSGISDIALATSSIGAFAVITLVYILIRARIFH